SKAAAAAWKAASTSSSLELGEVAYASPVEGLMMSNTSPDADGRSSPLMMLEKTCLSAMAIPFSLYCLENPIIAPRVRGGCGHPCWTSCSGHQERGSVQRIRTA